MVSLFFFHVYLFNAYPSFHTSQEVFCRNFNSLLAGGYFVVRHPTWVLVSEIEATNGHDTYNGIIYSYDI